LDVLACSIPIEFNGVGEVNLRDYRDIGTVEDCGIFERLVLSFSDGEQDDFHGLRAFSTIAASK